jgi:cyanate permease
VSIGYAAKLVGKGIGSIALAGLGLLFAGWVYRKFGGWEFALSFLVAIASNIPMVLFFNIFPTAASKIKKNEKWVLESPKPDLFTDMFGHFNRDDKD